MEGVKAGVCEVYGWKDRQREEQIHADRSLCKTKEGCTEK